MQIRRDRDRLVDIDYIAQLQDSFSKALGLYTYCLDTAGVPVTEISGPTEDVERLMEYIPAEAIADNFFGLTQSVLEDQIIEDTLIPNIKFGLTTVRINGQPLVTWVVLAVITDPDTEGYRCEPAEGFSRTISYDRLQDALDLIRETTLYQIDVRQSIANAEAESRRSRYSEAEMSEALKRAEAMTEIVQLLDVDESIESVIGKIISLAGSYLDLSSALVYKLIPGTTEVMDIAASWYAQGVIPHFDSNRGVPRFSFLASDKVLSISSGSGVGDPKWLAQMEEIGIKAMVVIPVFAGENIIMYTAFNESRRERYWNVDEIKFLSDTTKILQSIVQKRLQKNNLAASYASLGEVLDNVGASIYVKELSTGRVLFANRMMRQFFTEELKNGEYEEIFEKSIPEASLAGSVEVEYRRKERHYELYYSYLSWMNSTNALLCAIHDVTEKKKYEKQIEQLAYTDFLTGLYNRMCCERDLAKFVDTTIAENRKGALLYLDLDDFKHINDGLGHQYGDMLLQAIAHSFTRVNGVQETCYRMGGDEFVIVIPPDSYKEKERIVEDIKNIFNRPWFLKDADYYCTMSMGVVNFPEEGTEVQDLIKKADITMYEAKKSGKNKVAIYSGDMDSESSKRLDMEKRMRDAAQNNYEDFLVYFQPVVDIQLDGTPCVGAEALVRWDNAELGFISPGDFIPLAEYLGLIIPIGTHVLKKACQACKKWNDSGHPNYKVNVNLSVVQLVQSDIVDIIKRTVQETEINPHNLTLEVTESLAINDLDKMKDVLAAIRSLGCRIALDDFGTGYSSLNHIRELPIDVIKVDQSFVRELASDDYSQAFVRYISDLATIIGKQICVEGIETVEQYSVLSDMKVRMVQGFYFSRPLPQAQFEEKYI